MITKSSLQLTRTISMLHYEKFWLKGWVTWTCHHGKIWLRAGMKNGVMEMTHKCTKLLKGDETQWAFGNFFFFFSLFPLIHRCGMCYLCAMSGRALALVKTLLPCSGSFSCLPWLAAQVALQKIESCTHSHTKKNNMLLHVIIIGLSYGVPGWLIWSLCKENGLLSG